MVTRTFLDKVTTIVSGSTDNYGLHPIAMLSYGPTVSRMLIHFNIDKILEEYADSHIDKEGEKYYIPIGNTRHILKMTNCGSLSSSFQKDILDSPDEVGYKKRAASFRVIALRLPDSERYQWDEGVGFDNSQDFWLIGDKSVSTDGANWFQSYNGMKWEEVGIFTTDTIWKAIEKYSGDTEDSIIIARQKFDHGNENLFLDITKYVNDIIEGKHKNNGICICFYPDLEEKQMEVSQYVGFFSNTTRTFFEPVVESRNDEPIRDNRNNFICGKENRLYCYLKEDGKFFDSKTKPKCIIDNQEYDVIRQRKGIYYATVKLNCSANIIKYDEWNNITFEDGTSLTEPAELEFVTKTRESSVSISGLMKPKSSFTCSCSGVNKYEKINQGDERIVKINFNIPYSKESPKDIRDVEYRLYVMDGENEIDVIEYDKADITADGIVFLLKTGEYVPGEYNVDIRAKSNSETRIFKNELIFTVVGNATERNI